MAGKPMIFTGFDHRTARVDFAIYQPEHSFPYVAEKTLAEAREFFQNGLKMCDEMDAFIHREIKPAATATEPQQEESK